MLIGLTAHQQPKDDTAPLHRRPSYREHDTNALDHQLGQTHSTHDNASPHKHVQAPQSADKILPDHEDQPSLLVHTHLQVSNDRDHHRNYKYHHRLGHNTVIPT